MLNILKPKTEQIQIKIIKIHGDIMEQLKVIENTDNQISAITSGEELPKSGVIAGLLVEKQEAEIIVNMLAKKRMAALKELAQSQADDNKVKYDKLQSKIDDGNNRIAKLDEQRKKIIEEIEPISTEQLHLSMKLNPQPLGKKLNGTEEVLKSIEDPFMPIADPVAYKKEVSRLLALQTANKKVLNDEFTGYWDDDVIGKNEKGETVKGKQPMIFTRTGFTVPRLKMSLDDNGQIIDADFFGTDYIDFKEEKRPGELQFTKLV